MADRKPLSKTDLQALIDFEIASATGIQGQQLQQDRSKALDYYQAKAFGNEIEDRSSIVSTDVRDTIEWIMPTLLRIFTSGEKVVEFEPSEPSDEPFAKQATEYVNYIWNRDNRGFRNFYVWFKDGLLSKNGVVKIYYDESKIPKRERYSGLDDQTYALIVNDDDVTVSEHTENEEQIELPGQPPQKMAVHDLVVTRQKPGGRVCIDNVPPEEFLISRNARDIQSARFVGHRTPTTLSELREEGIDEALLDKIGAGPDDIALSPEEISRNTVEDQGMLNDVNNTPMTPIWKTECFIKADVDGDGIAEMRKVTVAGPGSVILSDEAWDSPRPFADLTPIIMPHRFWGLSMADLVMDIQLIRSTILRQYLDNLYLSNNQRSEVVEKNIIDPTELLSSRPGGFVRVKEAGSVNPIIVPQIGDAALKGLEYIDQIRENRTGVSERTQGLGANQLHETAQGEQMLMTAAMGKIELIARNFAETGVRDAFKLILGLVCRYQQKPRIIRLTNNWVPMDPRSWNEDMDVSISVGMGTGDNQQKLQHAMMLAQMQGAAAQGGALKVTPDNAMATADLMVNAMGLKGPERFFTKPDPNQPPPPNPEMAKVQAQAQADQAKMQMDGQMKAQQMQMEAQSKSAQMQADAQGKAAEMQQTEQIELAKANREFEMKRYQIDQEMMLKREQLAAELQLKREEMQAELALKQRQIELGHQAALYASDTKVSSSVRPGGEPG